MPSRTSINVVIEIHGIVLPGLRLLSGRRCPCTVLMPGERALAAHMSVSWWGQVHVLCYLYRCLSILVERQKEYGCVFEQFPIGRIQWSSVLSRRPEKIKSILVAHWQHSILAEKPSIHGPCRLRAESQPDIRANGDSTSVCPLPIHPPRSSRGDQSFYRTEVSWLVVLLKVKIGCSWWTPFVHWKSHPNQCPMSISSIEWHVPGIRGR